MNNRTRPVIPDKSEVHGIAYAIDRDGQTVRYVGRGSIICSSRAAMRCVGMTLGSG